MYYKVKTCLSKWTIAVIIGLLLTLLLHYFIIYDYELPMKEVKFHVEIRQLIIRNSTAVSEQSVSESAVPESPFPESAAPKDKETDEYLVDTPGCYIPNFSKELKFKEAVTKNIPCGHRAIFVYKTTDEKISFHIDQNKLSKYTKQTDNVRCSYKFAQRSTVSGKEDSEIIYSPWQGFENGTTVYLEEEVVSVMCNLQLVKKIAIIYEDVYLILKKKQKTITYTKEKGTSWNVLLIGMDTMSRARFLATMPQTASHLQEHEWLDYKGYHKVGYNTFPNVMAMLSANNMSTIYSTCNKNQIECNKLLIWSKFKDAGYVTGYGEDFLQLPDTFSRFGFKIQPTDHYARPFFLTGETLKGNYVCAKHVASGLHLLDYASQFAETYKNENFFGLFWLNSFSHNLENKPELLDKDITDFFEKLNKTEVLDNTFVFFFSDHGTRYGASRLQIESFYEERLPLMYIWTPYRYRQLYTEDYFNLQINQNRLTTPYDLHMTFWDILKASDDSVNVTLAEACPQCSGFFTEKSRHRSCADALIDKRWCSCHKIYSVGKDEAKQSLQVAVTFVQTVSKSVKTTECNICSPFKLQSVIRTHAYKNELNNNTYYIVAFSLKPGDVHYEAIVEQTGGNYTVVPPTHSISSYNTRGNCVKQKYDREYCVCSAHVHCKPKR